MKNVLKHLIHQRSTASIEKEVKLSKYSGGQGTQQHLWQNVVDSKIIIIIVLVGVLSIEGM